MSRMNMYISSIGILIHILFWFYREEWNELVNLSRDTYLQRLRARAINGELKASKFRSVCWALLMGVLSGDSSSWTHQRQSYRKRFAINSLSIFYHYKILFLSALKQIR